MLADFAVFILSHGRADHVLTYDTVRQAGYTGPLYIVIDNEDTQADAYYARYGPKVLMFDKAAIAATFDEGTNFGDRRAVIYARNACFQLAQDLGIAYFMELDDDYSSFCYRFDDVYQFIKDTKVRNLDALFTLLLDYYRTIPALSLAVLQSGDLIGGSESQFAQSLHAVRKCMNTFLCATDRPFTFVGRINEDVNTYTWYQSLGNLFLSINSVVIHQGRSQANPGGMSELYLDSGTYVKSFYTVMYQPSSVTVQLLQSAHPRLHHRITWDCTVPCILAERYRKPL